MRRGGGFVPTRACRLRPITMAHSTTAAPELSMQLSIDYTRQIRQDSLRKYSPRDAYL